MTILEAIKEVLKDRPDGLTSRDIYDEIVNRDLYQFGAKTPVSVVNCEIRRHCYDLDFPTMSRTKYFIIVPHEGKKAKYALKSEKAEPVKAVPIKQLDADALPEERVASAVNEHLVQIKQQLLEAILNQSPAFFEQMVVELLLKMGYGYDETSGIVTGASHDGGIDGVINEDKLGLDLIYIQAKRYARDNKVGRKEIQSFVGAMEGVQKGVFITTSSFTKEAREYEKKQYSKHVRLIDGSMLTDLMIKHGVGVDSVKTFTIYKLSADYFME